jgi:hypothetical protein
VRVDRLVCDELVSVERERERATQFKGSTEIEMRLMITDLTDPISAEQRPVCGMNQFLMFE